MSSAQDLTSGNVLLAASDKDERGFVAKVADFGLSRLLQSSQTTIETDTFGKCQICDSWEAVYTALCVRPNFCQCCKAHICLLSGGNCTHALCTHRKKLAL